MTNNIEIEHNGNHLRFREMPALPLSRSGFFYSMGWDIDNYWAIDANGVAWLDVSGHGFGLKKCDSVRDILKAMEGEQSGGSEELRSLLGLKPLLPGWVWSARAAGWTPSATWDGSKYDEE